METPENLTATPRSTLRRRPDRGRRDREVINAILDETLVCHVGFSDNNGPTVIPATPWRIGKWLYLHGAANSRMIREVGSGIQICISVAMVDGLVLARSAMRHSMNYRSVVLFGRGEAVDAASDKSAALMQLIDKLSPGRSSTVRPPNQQELAATGVVRLEIAEGSAKIRTSPPSEVAIDKGWTAWTGTVPIAPVAGTPIAATGESGAPALPSWLGR